MKTKLLILAMTLTICFSSCMTTRTYVGAYKETEGTEYTYSKGKQMWILWGIIPMGRTHVATPVNGNCEVATKLNFADGLISLLTAGIVSSYTIKITAKKPIEQKSKKK